MQTKDGTCRPFGLRLLLSLLLVVFLSANHSVLICQAEEGNGVLRSRAYKFSYITSQRAQELLSQLNIGQSYDELSDDVLIVTSNHGSDLLKATEVLTLADQPQPVGIQVLLVGTADQPLPDIDVLSARMKGFTVGTMQDAPPKGSPNPVILDVMDNKLIGIAAEELMPKLQEEVDAWKEAAASTSEQKQQTFEKTIQPAAQETTPAKPAQVEGSESARTQPVKPAEEPNQPGAEISLQDVMKRLMAQESETTVPQATATEKAQTSEDLMGLLNQTEPNTTEDYMGDELLRTLLEEEQKTKPQPETEATPTEPQVAVQPEEKTQPEAEQESEAEKMISETPDLGEEKTLKEAIQMLMKEDAEAQQAAAAEAQTAQPAEQEQQRSAVVSENLRLQRELALLRQQLAAQQAQKEVTPPTEATIPLPEVTEPTPTVTESTPEAVEPEPEAPGVREPQPKILTEREPSLTEFQKAVGEETLETVVNLPQEVELESLVDLVGKQLGLNYMYDPAILRNQKVFLKIHQGRIKVKNLYNLLESVMRFKGFVMTRRDDLVTILKATDANQVAQQVDTVFRMPGDPIQPGDIIVSTIFQLEHVATGTAKTMLTNMRLGLTNGFQEIPETNTLIVTDYAYRMPRIEEVLQMIDVAGEEKEFQYRALKHMQAAELVDKLKDLVSKMEGVSMQTAAAQPQQPTRFTTQRRRNPQTGRIETVRVPVTTPPAAGGAAAAAQQATEETVFIETDERTNRILMIGTPTQIETINNLIDTLDVPQYDLKFVREYVIQNVEAVEVVNVLNELGLANLQVSGTNQAAQSAAAQRAAAVRAARARAGNQPPQPEAATPSAPSVSGGEGQPNISIRPATNSLLVNATAEQHEAIELVIAYVDVVQRDQRTIREYEIQNVDTQEIIDTMMELGIISQAPAASAAAQQRGRTTAGRSTRTGAQPQAQGEVAAGPAALTGLAGEEGASEDITAQEPQIAVLEATNSLLVYATPRQHKAISLLIAHADRVPETTSTPYVVYSLENQDPVELAEVLTKLIQETVEEVGATSTPESRIQTARPANAAAGGTAGPPTREEQSIKIVPDPASYSLIVYANKKNQLWIKDLIRELDEYRPQVLLDCTLVEVTQNEKFEYDLDIISKTYGASNLQSGTGDGAIIGQYQKFTNNQFIDARSDTSSEDAVLKAFFNSANVQALLTAIQTKGYGRVMARPKILVNDNQEGEIKTENQTSIAQQKSIVQPATGTSPSYTTTDVSFGDYTSGITLTIKPHISKGQMLRLEITLNRQDFDFSRGIDVSVAGDTYPRPPDLLSTDVTTVATVPDGTTIILGGLETIKQSKANSKIPILGDLPIIGGLFRGVNDSGQQGKLYVFVKANILRPSDQLGGLEDIRRVSSKYRKQFQEMEKQFQSLQDWPGIKPKPMTPAQVLEEDEELTANNELSQ